MKLKTKASMVLKSILAIFIITLMLATSAGAQNTISLDSKDTEIRELLSTLAKANGMNLILGDSVKGNTSISLSGVSPEEAMRLILIANGFAMEKVGSIIIAGRPDELKGFLPRSHKVVSLQHASATDLIQPLSAIASEYAVIQAEPRTNSVIIFGTESSIQSLEQIIGLLDVDITMAAEEFEAAAETRIFPLVYAQAPALEQIASGFSSPAGEIIVDDRTNSLVVTDTAAAIGRIETLLSQLDIETAEDKARSAKEAEPPPVIKTQIFNLNHVEATAIEEILREMLSSEGKLQTFVRQKEVLPPMKTTLSGSFGGGQSSGGQSGSGGGGGAAAGAGKTKWSDLLIITDTTGVLDSISNLIAQLDTKPPQVKIEARLVEANSNRVDDLGISWSAVHSSSGSTGDGNFPINKIEKVSFSLGTFTASQFEDILFKIEALETEGEANTIFNPSVMTLDNEAAQMLVADRIPIERTYETEFRATTGVEFINVGISLSVIPHITEDGYIIMDITPQVDYIKEWRNANPVISTRMANCRVRVKNGETFAISGLTKEEDKKSKSGIPILCRIPILGRLFGSSNDRNDKTDMMVFVTPTISVEEP